MSGPFLGQRLGADHADDDWAGAETDQIGHEQEDGHGGCRAEPQPGAGIADVKLGLYLPQQHREDSPENDWYSEN